MTHYVGEIFIDEYPPEAVYFCNNSQGGENPCHIAEIEPQDEHRRFQIVANPEPTEQEVIQRRVDELQAFLDSTDWYCSRYVDIGTPIPDDIKQQRSDARIEIDRLRHELEPSEDSDGDTNAESDIENENSVIEPTFVDEPTTEPTDQQ